MCFSATASFIAGGGLSAAGAETLRHAKTRERVPLAAIPLLFGIQQAIEGVVWVTFKAPLLNSIATHFFVFFSHVLWPTYFPFAVLMIEKNTSRQLILKIILLLGIATSLTLLFYSIIISTPIASIAGRSIVYDTFLPQIPFGLGLYVITICVTCFVSSHKFIRVLGMALLGSFAIAYWAYAEAFYSVWCFFAAILSFIIYVHLRTDLVERVKKNAKELQKRAGKRIEETRSAANGFRKKVEKTVSDELTSRK